MGFNSAFKGLKKCRVR